MKPTADDIKFAEGLQKRLVTYVVIYMNQLSNPSCKFDDWIIIGNRLHEKYGLECIVVGDVNQMIDYETYILPAVAHLPYWHCLIRQLTPGQLIEVIKRSQVVVADQSDITRSSISLKVPTVIFSSGPLKITGRNFNYIYGINNLNEIIDFFDANKITTFPYIEEQITWGHSINFIMNSIRSENWYGVQGKLRSCGGNMKEALRLQNNWNGALRDIIHEGDIVIDCGANEGHTTVLFAKQVGPTGRVIAVEADPKLIPMIEKNVQLNNLTNVEILNKCISDKSGYKVYFKHEVVQTINDGILVETICLNDLNHYKPTVVKMDIEGYELLGLKGASRLLKNKVRWEVEIHNSSGSGINMLTRFGFDPNEVINILIKNNYNLFYDSKPLVTGFIPESGCIIAVPK